MIYKNTNLIVRGKDNIHLRTCVLLNRIKCKINNSFFSEQENKC